MNRAKGTHPIWGNCDGKGALGCLFTLIVGAAAVLFAVQAGTPYVAYKGLEEDVATEISKAGAHYYSDEAIVQSILDLAKKNEVILTRQNITVDRYAGKVEVVINYSVPVDLLVVQHTFNFRIKASSLLGTL